MKFFSSKNKTKSEGKKGNFRFSLNGSAGSLNLFSNADSSSGEEDNEFNEVDGTDITDTTKDNGGESYSKEGMLSISQEDGLAEKTKLWKSAIDSKSGRIYWYNVETRETQWQKPACLASVEERKEVAEKERQQRDFFSVMEANILSSMAEGAISLNRSSSSSSLKDNSYISEGREDDVASNESLEDSPIQRRVCLSKTGSTNNLKNPLVKSRLVRTISTMEDSVLKSLVRRVPSHRSILKKPNMDAEWRKPNSVTPVDIKESANTGPRVRFGGIHFQPTHLTKLSINGLQSIHESGSSVNKDNKTDEGWPRDTEGHRQKFSGSDCKKPSEKHPSISREDSLNILALRSGSHRTNSFSNSLSLTALQQPSAIFNNSISISALQPQPNTNMYNNLASGSNDASSFAFRGSSNDLSGMNPVRGLNRSEDNMSVSLSGLMDGLKEGSGSEVDGDFLGLDASHSQFNFDLSNEELAAFGMLADITDKMVSADEDDAEFLEMYDKAKSEAASSIEGNDDNDDSDADDPDDDEDDENTMNNNDKMESGLDVLDEADETQSSLEPNAVDIKDTARVFFHQKTGDEREIVLIDASKKGSDTPLSDILKRDKLKSSTTTNDRELSLKRRSRSLRHVLSDKALLKKPGNLVRHNTCGAIYVGSTLSAPDQDATIRCVCGVYRAHLLQSERIEKEIQSLSDDDSNEDIITARAEWDLAVQEYQTKYSVFNDLESQQVYKETRPSMMKRQDAVRDISFSSGLSLGDEGGSSMLTLPTLDEITSFYRDVFQRAKMETDCIIISLIYVERLIKISDGILRPRAENWRSILFSCMVLSSKVWDDLSVWNVDFSLTCPAGVRFSLKRVNELEIAVLSALNFQVKVFSSEYAKYYFLLRSMLIKSGLASDNMASAMNPLDVEGARRLQYLSSRYEQQSLLTRSSLTSKLDGVSRSKSEGNAPSCTNDLSYFK